MPLKSVIVGTAGHIDHGKTALVKALTGTDTDRWEEEKRRGITIDIGFAHLELATDVGEILRFGFVDVPGHERFVRNMLAGIGGIDFVLLVVAADEGIKPQTREHFEICRLLGIQRGIVVLTKKDKVTDETLADTRGAIAQLVAGSFLENAAVIAVSAIRGDGLDELKRGMLEVGQQGSAKSTESLFRLPIDRVFTMKGHGSVVTGTLVSGKVEVGDEVEILPLRRRARVRSVQVHNNSVPAARAGERSALNLPGVTKEEIDRGMEVVFPDSFRAVDRADVKIDLLSGAAELKDGSRVHFYSFTSETVATVRLHNAKILAGGLSAFARLKLASPLLLVPGDRFIIRRFSPVVTIGGGVVLDASWSKHVDEKFLRTMLEGSDEEKLFSRVRRLRAAGMALSDAGLQTGWSGEKIENCAARLALSENLERIANILITTEALNESKQALLQTVAAFHKANPLVGGIKQEELRSAAHLSVPVFDVILGQLLAEKKLQTVEDQVRVHGRPVTFNDDEAQARDTIESAFQSAGLKVPSLREVLATLAVDKPRAQKIVTLLLREKVLVKLSDDLVFHASALAGLRQTMQAEKSRSTVIDVARFKDLTGISRKYAIPLLEFLDRERITRREGNSRIIL